MKNEIIAYSVERIAYSKNKNILLSFLSAKRYPLNAIKSAIRYPLSAKDGFSLIEVLVALVIISLAGAGILSSFIAAEHFVERSGRRITAFNFARQQLERLKPYVRQDTWANVSICDPETNGLAVTSSLSCVGSDAGWTSWSNFTGDFGTTWNGRRRYKVEASSGDYRNVTTEIRWRAAD